MYFRFFISWYYWPPIACSKSHVPVLENKYSDTKLSHCGFSCFQALPVMPVNLSLVTGWDFVLAGVASVIRGAADCIDAVLLEVF